jgi:hypothetical protein
MMKNTALVMMTIAMTLTLGCGGSQEEAEAPVEEIAEAAPVAEEVVEVRHDQLYVCACEECDCGAVATSPGSCGCGTELAETHLLKVEENEALVCSCGSGCTCDLDAENPAACSCGTEVKRVSLEGTGVYYCNCGGSCTCKFAAAEAGDCACGMTLITS